MLFARPNSVAYKIYLYSTKRKADRLNCFSKFLKTTSVYVQERKPSKAGSWVDEWVSKTSDCNAGDRCLFPGFNQESTWVSLNNDHHCLLVVTKC